LVGGIRGVEWYIKENGPVGCSIYVIGFQATWLRVILVMLDIYFYFSYIPCTGLYEEEFPLYSESHSTTSLLALQA
jgi:hypothetical protein